MVKLKKSTPAATQSPAAPRRPVPSEAARKEQRSAATFLARIDEYAAGLRRLRQDAFALPSRPSPGANLCRPTQQRTRWRLPTRSARALAGISWRH
jgi:hypothetical protein